MKKITISAIMALILCMFCGIIGSYKEVDRLTDKFIRIHVIANSDSESDQDLKLKVRDGILSEAEKIFYKCSDKASAMEAAEKNLDRLTDAAKKVIAEQGFTYDAVCTLKKERFDERVYDGFTLPAGEYDSLCIRIGSAGGRNWWCICYPQMCIGAAAKIDESAVFTDGELRIVKEPQKVKYKLWCYEIVQKILKIFRSGG